MLKVLRQAVIRQKTILLHLLIILLLINICWCTSVCFCSILVKLDNFNKTTSTCNSVSFNPAWFLDKNVVDNHE